MAEVFDILVKLVDGATWPWRVAIWWAVETQLWVVATVVSTFLMVVMAPFNIIQGALRESATRHRLKELQMELDRMALAVEALEEKANLELAERLRLTASLNNAIRQKNLLRERLTETSEQIEQLEASKWQVEEDAKAAFEAKAIADAEVKRAALLVDEVQRRTGELSDISIPHVLSPEEEVHSNGIQNTNPLAQYGSDLAGLESPSEMAAALPAQLAASPVMTLLLAIPSALIVGAVAVTMLYAGCSVRHVVTWLLGAATLVGCLSNPLQDEVSPDLAPKVRVAIPLMLIASCVYGLLVSWGKGMPAVPAVEAAPVQAGPGTTALAAV